MSDQWLWWREALAGKPVDSEVGNPRSGFWKASRDEPIAIWRDEAGKVCCERVMFGGGERMHLDKIDELYASASRYPLDEATYDAARRGEPPLGYKTRLSLKEIEAKVVWSLELGRRKVGAEIAAEVASKKIAEPQSTPADAPENPVAVIGHNEPPEPLSPDKALAAEIFRTSAGIKIWLKEIGGKPRNKPEADRLADYATTFGRLRKSAVDQHKAEKAPVLEQSRAIDAKWFVSRDNAETSRKNCLRTAQDWMDAENARLAAEAARANAEAEASAARAAKQYDAPVSAPPPVEPDRVTGIGNMRTVATRTRTIWTVTDPRAYGAYLLAMKEIPPDLLTTLTTLADRQGKAGVEMPGVTKENRRSAA